MTATQESKGKRCRGRSWRRRAARLGHQPDVGELTLLDRYAVADAFASLIGNDADGVGAADQYRVFERLRARSAQPAPVPSTQQLPTKRERRRYGSWQGLADEHGLHRRHFLGRSSQLLADRNARPPDAPRAAGELAVVHPIVRRRLQPCRNRALPPQPRRVWP